MAMGRKEVLKTAAEHDVVTKWRKVLCYTQRAGVCKKVKKQLNKRARKAGKTIEME